MKEITLNIPDSVDIDDNYLTLILASKLYEIGRLSLGQAAEMAGMTKPSFAELLSKFQVSIFNHSAEDLTTDVLNA